MNHSENIFKYKSQHSGHPNGTRDGGFSNDTGAGPGTWFLQLKINGKVISTNRMLKVN